MVSRYASGAPRMTTQVFPKSDHVVALTHTNPSRGPNRLTISSCRDRGLDLIRPVFELIRQQHLSRRFTQGQNNMPDPPDVMSMIPIRLLVSSYQISQTHICVAAIH